MKNIVIDVQELSKSFGTHHAIEKCSYQIQKGEIFGFLGPSGAGKTTTIKLLTGQLHSDEGIISILNENPFSEVIKNKIGIMSDNSGLYEKMSVYDNLKLFADIYGVEYSRVDEVLNEVDLYDNRKKLVEKLSRGMRQRVIFARTILHSPEILFLDEPTANLDPATAQEVRNIIKKLNNNGSTVFLTTHNMEEADELCDRVAFLNKGHIIECGKPHDLKLKYSKQTISLLSNQGEKIIPLDKELLIKELQDMNELKKIHSIEPTMKEVFLMLTEGENL